MEGFPLSGQAGATLQCLAALGHIPGQVLLLDWIPTTGLQHSLLSLCIQHLVSLNLLLIILTLLSLNYLYSPLLCCLESLSSLHRTLETALLCYDQMFLFMLPYNVTCE